MVPMHECKLVEATQNAKLGPRCQSRGAELSF